MDVVDRKILKAHQHWPDLPMTELAEKVGLSHTACWKRLKRLEKEGFIERRVVILNQKALGLNVTVMAHVKLDRNVTETLDAFEKAVHEYPAILSCYSMSGESDYILFIVARSIEDYEIFLKEKLAKLPHVASLNSSFALKCVKNSTSLPV